MSTKLESYIKEIKNFLEENYICYEYKTPYFDSNEQLIKYQVRNEIFINDLLNVFVNETTYKRLLEYLRNHVFSVIH